MKLNFKRPSPPKSATLYKVGARQNGNDSMVWIVVADKNGTHRWAPATSVMKSFIKYKTKEKIIKKKKSREPAVKAKLQTPNRQKPIDAIEWIKQNKRSFKKLVEVHDAQSAKFEKDELKNELAKVVEGWGVLTRRNQDLPDTRLAQASSRELKSHYDWYYSDEGQAILAKVFADLILKVLK